MHVKLYEMIYNHVKYHKMIQDHTKVIGKLKKYDGNPLFDNLKRHWIIKKLVFENGKQTFENNYILSKNLKPR